MLVDRPVFYTDANKSFIKLVMKKTRFHQIAQTLFINQRNDERIFILSRRHTIGFLWFIITFSFLLVFPFIVFLFSNDTLSQTIASVSSQDGVYYRDALIIASTGYYLIFSTILLSAWVNHYYSLLIVTDERIIEIIQKGLFARHINEMTFEQIEDVSCKTQGILNTFFDVGDLEIQTAGSLRNFSIKEISYPELVAEIVLELAHQAKTGVSIQKRVPDLPVIAIIDKVLIYKGQDMPKIMNFGQNLAEAVKESRSHLSRKPRSIRERFDCWWWNTCNNSLIDFEAEEKRRNGRV